MAKRLNKKMVVGLTISGMVLTTAAGVLMVINLPEKDPQPVVDQAETMADRGEYQEAMKLYHKAWGRARDSKWAADANAYLVLAGDMALKAGLGREASEFWSRVMLNDPQHEEAQERIVKLHLEFAKLLGGRHWGRVQTEAEKLAGVNGINPNSYVGLHALGLALIQQRAIDDKYAEEGKEKLIAAVNGDKSNPEYANSLAQLYFRENQVEDAVNVYNVLIGENPSDDPKELATAYLYRGQFYLLQMKRRALVLLRQKGPGTRAAELASLRAQVAEADEKAHDDLEKAVKLAPNNIDALVGLGQYWQFKESDAADEATRESQIADFRAQAKEHYEQAIKADPEDFKGYRQLAQLYASDRRYDEALQVLKERMARGYEREHYLAWLNLANMAALRSDTFQINIGRLYALSRERGNAEDYQNRRQEIIDELWELHNESAAEAPGGEDEPSALFMKGRLLMLEGDKLGAISALEKADKLATNVFPDLKRTLASLYLQAGLPGPAKEAIRASLGVLPNDQVALSVLASAHLQSYDPEHPEELDKAIATAQRILAINPENREVLRLLYRAYELQQNFEGMATVQRQLDQGEDPIQDKLHRAALLRLQSDANPALAARAETLFREVLEADPVNLLAVRNLVLMLNQNPERSGEIQKLLNQTKAAAEAKLAELATATQPSDQLRKRYTTALDTVGRLSIFVDRSTSDEEKVQQMEELIKQGEDPYVVAVQLFELYRRLPERFDEALEQLEEAHERKPEESGVIELLFQSALAKQKWDLAEKCIKEAVDAGLDVTGGHFYRGRLLLARAREEGEYAERALDEIRAGLSKFPRFPNGHVWLGEAFLRLRQYAKAVEAFEEARQMNPRNGAAVVGIAMAADAQGDEEALGKHLATCMRLSPNHPWVRQKLAVLEERRDPKKWIAKREEARKGSPEDMPNLLALADLYVRDGQPEAAGAIYEECRKLEPDNIAVARAYSRLLRTKEPPDPAAAERVLRELVQAVDAKEPARKALTQIMLASHLLAVAQQGGGGTSKEELDKIDAAYRAAASLADQPEVHMDIGTYFMRTARYEEAESWFRKAIAGAQKGRNTEDQKQPRSLLLEALLGARDLKRADDLQKEIDAYRELFPEDPVADLFQGRWETVRGNDRRAINSFTTYVKNVPELPIGHYRRAAVHYRQSHWEEAIKDLREVKRLAPSFFGYGPRLLLAEALEHNGDLDGAISELRSILTEDSGALAAVHELLGVYARLERWDSADSLLAPRAEADPANPLWPQLRAQIAVQRKQVDPAVRFAREAAEKSQLDPNMVDFLLATYLEFGRYDELIAFVNDKIPPEKQNSLLQLRVASAYAGKRDADKAVEWQVKALQADVPAIEAFAMALSEDVQKRLDADAALQAVSKRLESNPQERPSKLVAAFLERAKGNLDAFTKAIQDLLKTTSADDPKDKRMYLFMMRELALASYKNERYQEAKESYEKILKVNERDIVALNNLAYLLMDDLQDPKGAERYAKAAAAAAPDNAGILDTLGWNYVLLGQYDDAIAVLRQAIGSSSETPPLHYHVAEAFFRRGSADGAKDPQGDQEEARTECQRAHQLIMAVGQDREKILDEVVALGEKLGLTLEKNLPDQRTVGTR